MEPNNNKSAWGTMNKTFASSAHISHWETRPRNMMTGTGSVSWTTKHNVQRWHKDWRLGLPRWSDGVLAKQAAEWERPLSSQLAE